MILEILGTTLLAVMVVILISFFISLVLPFLINEGMIQWKRLIAEWKNKP